MSSSAVEKWSRKDRSQLNYLLPKENYQQLCNRNLSNYAITSPREKKTSTTAIHDTSKRNRKETPRRSIMKEMTINRMLHNGGFRTICIDLPFDRFLRAVITFRGQLLNPHWQQQHAALIRCCSCSVVIERFKALEAHAHSHTVSRTSNWKLYTDYGVNYYRKNPSNVPLFALAFRHLSSCSFWKVLQRKR